MSTKNFNVPNSLCVLRILLIPIFIILFLKGGNYLYGACFVLVFSGITDMLDGAIARKFNQITKLGQVLDPIADKLTLGAVAVCMIIYFFEYTPIVVLFALFILKEFLMFIGSVILVTKGKRPTEAKWFGKVATVVFYFSTSIIILLQAMFNKDNLWITWVLVAITAIMFAIAFIGYSKVFLAINNSDNQKND